jgi:hypothetical protein
MADREQPIGHSVDGLCGWRGCRCALVLATFGVYGVIAFMVATRTREIGIPVALGASRARALRDVRGDALKLVIPGIGVGLVLVVLWVRLGDPSWYPLGRVSPDARPPHDARCSFSSSGDTTTHGRLFLISLPSVGSSRTR